MSQQTTPLQDVETAIHLAETAIEAKQPAGFRLPIGMINDAIEAAERAGIEIEPIADRLEQFFSAHCLVPAGVNFAYKAMASQLPNGHAISVHNIVRPIIADAIETCTDEQFAAVEPILARWSLKRTSATHASQALQRRSYLHAQAAG